MAKRQESEFDRIDLFVRQFARARVPVGVGDDCAVLRSRPGTELCVTTDSIVEDVHFTRAAFSFEDIGHKALAVNLSDLAAMGATPAWFVCALQIPRDLADPQLVAMGRGMGALARQFGAALVGGNVTRADKLAITITAAGEVPRGKALLRGGARAGDLLYVSGTLGDAAAGLEGGPAALKARQLRPTPRVELGRLALRFAHAAIDVSDGLAQDLGHLCAASGVGARVELSALPLSDALRAHAGDRAIGLALSGGEDYELVLAVPPRRARGFEAACARARQRVTRVGEVTTRRGLRLVGVDGRLLKAPPGFDHFIDRSARRH